MVEEKVFEIMESVLKEMQLGKTVEDRYGTDITEGNKNNFKILPKIFYSTFFFTFKIKWKSLK